MVFFLENTDIRALHPSHIHKTCFQESKMKAGRFGEETPIWDQIQFLDHHIKEKRRLYLLPYYFMMVSVCAPGHYPWGEKKATVPCISSVQLLSRVQLFATPWTAARQASLSITNSQSLLKLMSMESVMPSSHLILCRPLLLLSSIPLSIRVFSSDSTLRMRWPKYWSFSFNISSMYNYPQSGSLVQ